MILYGDCFELLSELTNETIDSVVTDPPYGLSKEPDAAEVLTKWISGEPYDHGYDGFMGKAWDSFVPHPDVWKQVFRVLKPGGYALVFAGTRTQDLMTIALRLAGFEVRDVIEWLYFSGFPKSMDVSKAFDKRAGAEPQVIAEGPTVKRMIPGADQDRTGSWIKDSGNTFTHTKTAPATEPGHVWEGWGTALKPAHEPIIVVRKPLIGTVVENVEKYRTGAINIDGCRIRRAEGDRTDYGVSGDEASAVTTDIYGKFAERLAYTHNEAGRFPANVVTTDEDSFFSPYFNVTPREVCKKAGKADRGTGNTHPTVKPTDLMAWLVRLVTPPGGTVLDPFAGSGSTLVAAKREGFRFIGIERESEYIGIIETRTGFGREVSDEEFEALLA